LDWKKEARGDAFKGKCSGGKSWIQRNQRKLAEQNKTEAWIPTLLKEQPDTKAREARSQPG
jgi:hypothetical protein